MLQHTESEKKQLYQESLLKTIFQANRVHPLKKQL